MSRKLPKLAIRWRSLCRCGLLLLATVGCKSTASRTSFASSQPNPPVVYSATVIQASASAQAETEAETIKQNLATSYYPLPADTETKPLKVWEERMKESPDQKIVIQGGPGCKEGLASVKVSGGPAILTYPLSTDNSSVKVRGTAGKGDPGGSMNVGTSQLGQPNPNRVGVGLQADF